MSKTTKKNEITKGEDLEELKNKINSIILSCDPSYILKSFDNEVLLRRADKKFRLTKKKSFLSTQAMLINNFENHSLLSKVTTEMLEPFALEFAQQLIKEYDCRTVSQKALVHTIVESYLRIMNISTKLTHNFPTESFTELRVHFLSQLGKELDRAHRHFLGALQALKTIKAPSVKVQIKAQNAFLAKNQKNLTLNEINDEQ